MRTLFCALLILGGYSSFSQGYISVAPSLTNTPGMIRDKMNLAFEIGQQWDVFSLGIDYGKTTFSPISGKDTSNYLEIRPNLNIFQEGRFTNTFTAGIGYIFGAEENLLTEVTYGIEYASTDNLHFNVFFGNYYYSGKISASNVSFFGVSAAYYFKSYKNGSIIKHDTK